MIFTRVKSVKTSFSLPYIHQKIHFINILMLRHNKTHKNINSGCVLNHYKYEETIQLVFIKREVYECEDVQLGKGCTYAKHLTS